MSQQPGEYRPESTPPGGPGYGGSTPPGGPGYGRGAWQGPSGDGRSGYEVQYGPGAAGRTNVLAIVSLVTSVVGLGIVGIVTGHIARGQIRRSGEAGDGLALAGLIIGYVVTILEVLVFLAVIGLFVVVGSDVS